LRFVTLQACSAIAPAGENFCAQATRRVMRSGRIRHVSAAICARDELMHPPTPKN
jgi:hypothetical protein